MYYKEINEYYKTIYHKDIPSATLNRWVKNGSIIAQKTKNGKYDYDFESFKAKIESSDYIARVKAIKQKPENYIGKIHNFLYITGIVPKEEKRENYKGTLMYCDCLKCGKKHFQVRFSYLTSNGNYSQTSCGCDRKEKAFLSSNIRKDITSELLFTFLDDFDKYLFIHKALIHNTEGYYIDCSIEEYLTTVSYFYNDEQFNNIYNNWKSQEQTGTYYDFYKPSLDHIIPRSKGGNNKLENLQFLTVFENLAKRDFTQEEWENFKKDTNTKSNLFI